jgi:hypothetical protein
LIEESVDVPQVTTGAFNGIFFVAALAAVAVGSLMFSLLQLKKMASSNAIVTTANFNDFMIYCFG